MIAMVRAGGTAVLWSLLNNLCMRPWKRRHLRRHGGRRNRMLRRHGIDRGDGKILMKMIRLDVKPISVNRAHRVTKQGRVIKSKQYCEFEKAVWHGVLQQAGKPCKLPQGKLALRVTFGISHRFDLDNGLKCLIDALEKVYRFNDCEIYAIEACKAEVKRGAEFIEFCFFQYATCAVKSV